MQSLILQLELSIKLILVQQEVKFEVKLEFSELILVKVSSEVLMNIIKYNEEYLIEVFINSVLVLTLYWPIISALEMELARLTLNSDNDVNYQSRL